MRRIIFLLSLSLLFFIVADYSFSANHENDPPGCTVSQDYDLNFMPAVLQPVDDIKPVLYVSTCLIENQNTEVNSWQPAAFKYPDYGLCYRSYDYQLSLNSIELSTYTDKDNPDNNFRWAEKPTSRHV